MLSCKEVSRLVSESLDRKLPVWQRGQLWLHLKLCKLCSGFRDDLNDIRDAAQTEASPDEELANDAGQSLSPEARERIQRALQSVESGDQSPTRNSAS